MRVLLIEDYEPLARSVAQGLRESGYSVDVSGDGREGLEHARSNPYDAIVLDLMLPGMDGMGLLRALREKGGQVPVLIISARDRVPDRVAGLNLGADDYLVKPFAFEELLARLRAIIRRRYQSPDGLIRIADLEIDTASRTVRRAEKNVPLSAREYALLEYLALRHDQVVSRTEIWDHVYDFNSDPSSNVIDVYVGYLRRKVDQDQPVKLIHTRRGQGYVLGEKA